MDCKTKEKNRITHTMNRVFFDLRKVVDRSFL